MLVGISIRKMFNQSKGEEILWRIYMKMKITLEIEAEICPYWNYEKHTYEHSCHACHCALYGNTLRNAEHGVMIDKDRYCTLNADIYADMIEAIRVIKEGENE